MSDALGGLATALELLLTVLLLLGVLRAALASALLLTVFGIAMLISLGPKAPLDYNVFTAAAAAFSLYSLRRSGLAPFAKKSRLCSVAGLRMRS